MDLAGKVLSSLNPKQEEETSSHFYQNGSALLEGLIAISNGRYDIPIRNFTTKELVVATNNFSELVFVRNETVMFKGDFEGRRVLVNKWEGGRGFSRDEAIRDIVISSHTSHFKNVLKLVGCCLEFENPASVYEYAGNQLLSDFLDLENGNMLLSWRSRIKIANDIASTVLYLHTAFQTPIIYRNLKPSKVIIDQHGVAKLFDFTLSISLPPGELRVEDDLKGTFGFIDPEYGRTNYVTQKTDVYGFGVVLLMLLTGKPVVFENHEGERVHILKFVEDYADNYQFDQFIDPRILGKEGLIGCPNLLQSFLDLALMCTREKGEERPDMIEIARELRQIEKGARG